jgi:hypothetical protein
MVILNSGRFTAKLGGQTICDLSGQQNKTVTYFRNLTPGISALELTARDHGANKFNVEFEVKIAKTGSMESLAGPFSFLNPQDNASGKVQGITLELEVPTAQSNEKSDKNGGTQ